MVVSRGRAVQVEPGVGSACSQNGNQVLYPKQWAGGQKEELRIEWLWSTTKVVWKGEDLNFIPGEVGTKQESSEQEITGPDLTL